jgi:hypothetical protein
MYLAIRRASGTATSTDDAEDGDQHEPGDDRQMLEEDIELPDSLNPVERPELMRHHGRERPRLAVRGITASMSASYQC